MDLLKKYFPQITEFQVEKLILFKDLIKQWNKKINLVSRKDVENFEVNHMLHSLSISKFIKTYYPKTPKLVYFKNNLEPTRIYQNIDLLKKELQIKVYLI